MDKNKIVNSVYLVTAILEVLNGNKNKNILNILKEYDINVRDFKDLKSILNYHLHIIKTDFEPNYNLLRKGLDEYFNKYLKDFWKYINIENTNYSLLDYGSGNGCYSDAFIKANPNGNITMIDKYLGIDFEKNPNWYKEKFIGKYDIVLLSEILHCKGLKGKKYLIESSLECLKKKGKLIINENLDPFMGWRLNKLTTNGDLVTKDELSLLLAKYSLKLKKITNINYHHIYIYEKL